MLVGVPDKSAGIFGPKDAIKQAKVNLAELLRDPAMRKRYERVT